MRALPLRATLKVMNVLIAGGGVAALEAALALRDEDRVSVEVVAPDTEFTYRPLAVAEPFRVADVRSFPLKVLVEKAGAELRRGTLVSVDPDRHIVRTDEDDELSYDVLLLALGARPRPVVTNALTFSGPADGRALRALLDEALAGEVRHVSFALPAGVAWPLPLYELALLTYTHLTDAGAANIRLTIVTPEDAPLGLFGEEASDAVRELLEMRGIEVVTGTTPVAFEDGALRLAPDGRLETDRVVAMPKLEGAPPDGVPHDAEGFVPVDEHGRVVGVDDVLAAGDLTTFPVKQGGIATQQADAAAATIAAQAGAPIDPEPFRPVLRGILLTGVFPRYLRAELGKRSSTVDTEPLWWPPAKIVGRHLAPFLAEQLGLSEQPPPSLAEGAVRVEVDLDSH
jgi:sulfide:quinone oxidoreductase